MSKIIVNCETGEVTETELSADDLAQQVIDEAAETARQAKEQAKAAARQALLDKLGITEDEAKLLLGGN